MHAAEALQVSLMARREDPGQPFKTPRVPRPKGAQKGVTRRDNGRRSQGTNARVPDGKPVRVTRGY